MYATLVHYTRSWRASLCLLPLCIYFLAARGEYTLLDHADLVIHEAGHFFFRFFGTFLYMMGGTLMQIILPGILFRHFYRNDYCTGAQVSLFWLGHNLLNISVYAADARLRALPLLGGSNAIHDWWFVLGQTGLLHYDYLFGYAFLAAAVLVWGVCLALPRTMVL